jgi:hypothetical protein
VRLQRGARVAPLEEERQRLHLDLWMADRTLTVLRCWRKTGPDEIGGQLADAIDDRAEIQLPQLFRPSTCE